jgi:hypothetical protein
LEHVKFVCDELLVKNGERFKHISIQLEECQESMLKCIINISRAPRLSLTIRYVPVAQNETTQNSKPKPE